MRMRAYEVLRESPDRDLDTLRQAQRAASAFSGWLSDNNETTSLNDTDMLRVQTRKGDRLWLKRAPDVGINVPELYVGIGWNPNPKMRTSRAYVVTSTDENNQQKILLIMMVDEDPGNRTDIGWGLRWNDFIHEWTHVMDYLRGYLTHKAKQEKTEYKEKTPSKYYNTPIEFNGFYKQGLDRMLMKLSRLASPDETVLKGQSQSAYFAMMQQRFHQMTYEQFKSQYGRDFDLDWLRHLNKNYKRRFTKRFYQLYKYVQQNWPDINAIRDHQAETAEIEARLDARDAAEQQKLAA